jgi:adenylate cyclase
MTMENSKRKLIAVVHADVKGYSRMMGEDEDYTVRTLASNRQEMYRLVKFHRGWVRDTAGDGFLVEFTSVVDAVLFSVDFQQEMKKRNAYLPEAKKMEFRLGANIGDVIYDGGTIYGEGVNIAARLESLADPGGICISGAAYEQVKKRLDVGFECMGDKSVKNIAEPVPAYKVLIGQGKPAEPKETSQHAKIRAWRKSYLIAAVIGIVVVASAAIWYFHFHSASQADKGRLAQEPTLKLPDKPSIAVLAFQNMSGDPEQEYFSDGLTEEIITGLSKMPHLFVIARNSSFAFKGKPVSVQEVGRKLGVRYVLEGSVRKEKDTVRITAQLIDAQTGGHVWSDRYDRVLKDIFALQDEVTLAVMRAMRVKLTEGEQAALWQRKGLTNNLVAFEKYLQGREYTMQGTARANDKARQLWEEAIALDPGYAAGYAGLAFAHVRDAIFGWTKDPGESGRKAYEIANKALTLDDSLDTPHYVLGMIYVLMREHDKAIAEGERGVELNPNGDEALAFLGYILNNSGRPAEAITVLKKAMRLNPMPPPSYYAWLGNGYRLTNQYDKAIAVLEKGLRVQPDYIPCLMNLAATYSLAGRQEDARKTAAEFLNLNPKFSVEAYAKLYKDPAVAEQLIDALHKAGVKSKGNTF